MARLTLVIMLFSCICMTSCNNNTALKKTNQPTDSIKKVKTIETNLVLLDRNTILKKLLKKMHDPSIKTFQYIVLRQS